MFACINIKKLWFLHFIFFSPFLLHFHSLTSSHRFWCCMWYYNRCMNYETLTGYKYQILFWVFFLLEIEYSHWERNKKKKKKKTIKRRKSDLSSCFQHGKLIDSHAGCGNCNAPHGTFYRFFPRKFFLCLEHTWLRNAFQLRKKKMNFRILLKCTLTMFGRDLRNSISTKCQAFQNSCSFHCSNDL